MSISALDYAKLGCKTLMNKFNPVTLPPVGGFHYHQGVFLSGVERVYEMCGDEKYFQYIKDWVDQFIVEGSGIPVGCRTEQLDDLQSAVLLINLYDKTGAEK